MSRLTPLLLAVAVLPLAQARAQTCTEPHYRWSEKIDASMATKTRIAVDVSEILAWTPRTITGKDKCAARIGHEKKVYTVTGYVRRIKTHETDGDWHVEITEDEATPVPANCIVVEIPAGSNDAMYGAARDSLTKLVDMSHLSSAGDLDTPVPVTFTGAAFFDGYHQHKTPTPHASSHGRCNSSLHALWEIHPVYAVTTPVGP